MSVTIRSFGPLGLGARQRTTKAPGSIRVQPAFPSRKLRAIGADIERVR